jgi:hypothetical protein
MMDHEPEEDGLEEAPEEEEEAEDMPVTGLDDEEEDPI